MAKYTVKQTGGARLRRYIAERRPLISWLDSLDLRVGFPDGFIMPLAILHEFGHRESGLPMRPAFRAGLIKMRPAWKRRCKAILREASKPDAHKATLRTMIRAAMAEQKILLVRSYESYHGAPLSERQQARKAGTPGEGKQLTGSEGPRLIGHISAWIGTNEI